MDIQQYIYNNTGVMLPISGGNGQSQEQAVIISPKYKHKYIQVQNDFISLWLDEGHWGKLEQSLIVDDGRKWDKVTIHQYLDDESIVEMVFWFEITESF
jgi:hypothetical protein